MNAPKTAAELRDFVTQAVRDGTADRQAMGAYFARCRCYAVGLQWMQTGNAAPGFERWIRRATNWLGETGPIRAQINRCTKHKIQVAAATNPEKLWIDALPPDHAEDIGAVQVADLIENVGNHIIDDSKILAAARRANDERTTAGAHGIGLALQTWPAELDMGGQTVQAMNRRVRAFDFDPVRLTLETHNKSTDLRDHDQVIYSEPMTEHAIGRFFGPQMLERIDPGSLKTIEALMPVEMQFHHLSAGSMYAHYAAIRGNKAAMVHFAHFKSASGRWDRVYIMIEATEKRARSGEYITPNIDDPRSPWGADGLPYALLYGHLRPVSRVPISDVGMMIDDQDKLNLFASMYFQQLYDFTQYSNLVDREWFGHGQGKLSDDQIRKAVASRVIIGSERAGGKRPEIMLRPAPSATISQDIENAKEEMREQAFRTQAHQGKLKSHVTTTQWAGAVELSQIPHDDRITSDIENCYQPLIAVLIATSIGNLQASSPFTARLFQEAGLSPDELGQLASMDTTRLPATIVVRQETVRRRSRAQRKADLDNAFSLGTITPDQYNEALATDLDMPLTGLQKMAHRYARRTAHRVLMGMPFTPLPLGTYGYPLITELQRALMSDSAQADPAAMDRLNQAIIDQKEFMAMEMGQAAQQPSGSAAPEQPQVPEEANMLDLFESLAPASALSG